MCELYLKFCKACINAYVGKMHKNHAKSMKLDKSDKLENYKNLSVIVYTLSPAAPYNLFTWVFPTYKVVLLFSPHFIVFLLCNVLYSTLK